jgi:aminoglycoside phosphotransferase family enzyme/gluconate kinase
MNATSPQPELIDSLLESELYPHPVDNIQLIETHISWVILTGPYAYKIKKPVDFGFLDFSTLEKRKLFCNEEIRLNRRLAADIYLEVIHITGTAAQPVFNGEDEVIEYAVKMKQFPQEAQLDHMLAAGKLQPTHIDAIADMLADFHQQIDVADSKSTFGEPEHVHQPVKENFRQIRAHIKDKKYLEKLDELEHWSQSSFALLEPVLIKRKRDSFIRECHGDMHLRNIAWVNNAPVAFDCLEFNPELRWIDVISEIAFLVMDLQDRQQPQLAQRFLNAYLERSGDYAGLRVLPFYLAYRALVRAKVDAIRSQQTGISEQEQREAEAGFDAYLQIAQTYTQAPAPQLYITRGVSASGKSTLTGQLLEQLGAIRIRSDVERKRLFNIQADENSQAAIEQGIYSAQATEKTYNRLTKLAAIVLDAGYRVIIDAACLKLEQRKLFHNLAKTKQLPCIILDFTASTDTLYQRIRERTDDVSDADIKVLEHQLKNWRPLEKDEQKFSISINTDVSLEIDELVEQIRKIAVKS